VFIQRVGTNVLPPLSGDGLDDRTASAPVLSPSPGLNRIEPIKTHHLNSRRLVVPYIVVVILFRRANFYTLTRAVTRSSAATDGTRKLLNFRTTHLRKNSIGLGSASSSASIASSRSTQHFWRRRLSSTSPALSALALHGEVPLHTAKSR